MLMIDLRNPRIGYRSFVLAFYLFTIYYDFKYLPNSPIRNSFPGRLKFLTFLNLLMQTAFFLVALCGDVLKVYGLKSKYLESPTVSRKWNSFKCCVVFPVCAFVAFTFWILYTYDREVIFPEKLDKYVPAWLNHSWHSLVFLFLIGDYYLEEREYPDRREGMITSLKFMLTYGCWVILIWLFTSDWVYPVLHNFTWLQRLAFSFLCCLITVASYNLGQLINRFFWGRKSLTSYHATEKEPLEPKGDKIY